MIPHAQSKGRSCSAPVNSLRENYSEKIVAGLYKDSQFTPWSNDKDINDLNQVHSKRLPSKSFLSTSAPSKKQSTHSSKLKPTKWLGHLTNPQRCAAQYVFQHHMDHTKYIEDYRNMKLEHAKMSDADLEHTQIPNVFQEDLRTFERGQPLSLSSRIVNHHPTTPIVGRREKRTELAYPRALSSPSKSLPGRGSNTGATHYENKHKLMVTTLPKCDGVFFSCKNPLSTHELESEHLLRCKKLSELVPTLLDTGTHHNSSNNGKPNSRRKKSNIQIQKEHDRQKFKRTSQVKYQDCTQIIKKVLGHYDPSQNVVRTGFTKCSESNFCIS